MIDNYIKAVTIGAMILSSAPFVFAQENINPSSLQFHSPVVNDDNSVSFFLNRKDADSVKVEIGGKQYDMQFDGNVWKYVIYDLPSDLYTYSFFVDGVESLDPGNVYVLRDVNSLKNVLIVPGGIGDLYSVKNIPHGTQYEIWYDSEFENMSRRLSIYTPPGYESSTGKSYPVLYLLHGMGGDETSWSTLGRAAEIFDNLIHRGDMKEMIVVMPNGNMAREAAPGFSSLGYEYPDFNLPYTMEGTFEKYFPEIISFVNKNFRTLPDKNNQAIAGLSMGGFHAMSISRLYPEKFGYVALFSAATDKEVENTIPLPNLYKNPENMFAAQFENPPLVYNIYIGKDDFLFNSNVALRMMFDDNQYLYNYTESDGGHEWKNWRKYLVDFLPILFRPND